MPVSNFHPEMLEVFRRAAEAPLSIRLPSRSDASRLRFRLNNLRKQMREERHRLLPLAERVQLSVREEPDGTFVLYAHVADEEFLSALRASGISVEDQIEAAETASDTLAGDDILGPDIAMPGADERARQALAEMFKDTEGEKK